MPDEDNDGTLDGIEISWSKEQNQLDQKTRKWEKLRIKAQQTPLVKYEKNEGKKYKKN